MQIYKGSWFGLGKEHDTKKDAHAWWHYALAAILFVAITFVVPGVSYLVLRLCNFLSPRYLQNNDYWWSWTIGRVFASYISSGTAIGLTDDPKFSGILDMIGAVYCIFVAAWNFAVGTNSFDVTVGILAGGIAFIVLGVKAFKMPINEENIKNEEN